MRTPNSFTVARLVKLAVKSLAALGIVGVVGIVGTQASCSLNTTEVVGCENNAECRAIFGVGSVCAADFFCEEVQPNVRCEKTYPENLLSDSSVTNDHFLVGSIEDRSKSIFAAFEKSIELAFRQANTQRSIDGKQIGVVFCNVAGDLEDGLSEEEAVDSSGRYLVDVLGVVAILGPALTSTTRLLYQEINQGENAAGVLMISPSATADSLSSLDNLAPTDDAPGDLWRTAPPDELQSRAIAVDMRTVGNGRAVVTDTVAVIHQDGGYGSGLATEFGQIFEDMGGIRPKLTPFSDVAQLTSAMTNVGNDANIQEVLFISSNTDDTIEFLNQAAANTGFDGKLIFLPDAADTSDVLGEADMGRFAVVRGSRPAPAAGPLYTNFVTAYMALFQEDPSMFSFTANAYDAAWLTAYAIGWAVANEDDLSGKALARGLRRVSAKGQQSVSVGSSEYGTALSRFGSGLTIDVSGASGQLDFNDREEIDGPMEIWQINGTTSESIYSIPPP